MYVIGICDDSEKYIKIIRDFIVKADNCPENIIFFEYLCGEQLLADIERKHDLLFIDICMPGMDGNKTAQKLRENNPTALVVFCSGVRQPTPELFKVQPFRYLDKKVGGEAVNNDIVEILSEMVKRAVPEYLTVQYKSKVIRVKIDGIIYVSIYLKQCMIHITQEEKDRLGLTDASDSDNEGIIYMKKIEEVKKELEFYGFEYAHKSFLVNFALIVRKEKENIFMVEDVYIHSSRSKDKKFTAKYLEYLNTKL